MNAFEGKNMFADIQWQVYTNRGFIDLRCKDTTGSFLTSGELSFHMPKQEAAIYQNLPKEGYVIRGILKRADYDLYPKIAGINGFLFELWQKETKSICYTYSGKSQVIDLYCDILEEKGLMQSEDLQKQFIGLWEKMEEVFQDDNEVIFELLNEVVNATAEEWNSLAEKTICAIRKKNKERLLVVGCIDWNNPPGLDHLKVYDDENIIYTFHCYAPHEFTHQRGVLQADCLYYNRVMPYPCEDIERYRDYQRVVYNDPNVYADYQKMDIEFLRDYMKPVENFIKRNPDKILWCGEFGTIRHADIKWRENWMRDMIKLLNERDIPYCVWNYLSTPNDGNRFSLVDDDSRKILSDELGKIIRGDVL